MFCILVYFSSYPMPWPLRPLPFKSGLARSWVRLALGSRRPLRVGSCLFASGQTGNVFYGLQGTLVYPSYPVYPLYPVESAVDAGTFVSTVHSSLSLLSRLSLRCGYMERGKVSKGEKSGTGKSQERESQERGKARKRESYEPHIPDLSRIFRNLVLYF